MFGLNSLLPSREKASSDSRKRFRITSAQNLELETVFKSNPRPCKEIQEELAKKVELPYRTVTIWFQNRRAKAKLSGEVLADHVFQWKPPVISDPKNDKRNPNDNPAGHQIDPNVSSFGLNDDSIKNDANSIKIDDMGLNENYNNQLLNQSVDTQLQNWSVNQPFASPSWANGIGRASMDSASFISDYSHYDGLNINQSDFDQYLVRSSMLDGRQKFVQQPNNSNNSFDNTQNMMLNGGMYTPPLSNSVISFSSQNSTNASFNGEILNNGFVNGQGVYQSNFGSVQSLPHFVNNSVSNQMNSQGFMYQNPIQSAPEINLQQSLLLQRQQAGNPQAQIKAQVRAKIQRQRNDAMFFSMRS